MVFTREYGITLGVPKYLKGTGSTSERLLSSPIFTQNSKSVNIVGTSWGLWFP